MAATSRAERMLNDPLQKIIPRLAIPTIISMLISSIYNMADTYFVSQLSTEAAAAVGVVFTAMAVIQALAFTISMGSGTNLSQLLGRRKTEDAAVFASVGFFTAFGLGLLLMVLGRLNITSLVRFLGANEQIVPDAIAYATYIFYAAPFMMTSFVMNTLLRFQGLSFLSMIGITAGGVLNILLDPLLIFGFHLGTAGAAIATAVSQFVSFCILLAVTTFRREAISIQPKYFRPTRSLYGKIFYNGLPSLGRQGIASLSSLMINRVAGTISPDLAINTAAIASISIVNRFIYFINSAVIGFGQGFQPVCGICYGAGRYRRVREAYFFCVKVTTLLLLILSALAQPMAGNIIRLFRADDPLVIEIGTRFLHLQLLTLPLWGLNVMSNMCTQSMGYGLTSTIISISRQGLFLIPLVLLFPQFWGLLGLQVAPPVADSLAFVLSILIMRRVMRELSQREEHPLPGQ